MAPWSRSASSYRSARFFPEAARRRRGKSPDVRRRLLIESLEDRVVLTGPNPLEAVNTALSPAQLAQMLVGPGVTVSNVTFSGGAGSAGAFAFNDPAVVGFGQGIILSSGSAADVVGPNTSDWTSTDFALPGDADLDLLSGYGTHDAAVLEFDFTPTANQVVFQYAFASDEYPEYVNTVFNDVFAFYVNGTNYATVRQVAGDPSSPFVPVAVNNINNGNPQYSPDFVPVRPDLFRANDYVDPGPSAIDLELDGITQVLTFQAPVVPGVTNHMKLAIADASDGIYDSAVFIQAGSLVSNENPVADLSLSTSGGPAPLLVTAFIEGEDPNGLPLTYTIDWGDGTEPSQGPLDSPSDESEKTASVDHVYTVPGEYFVTLTVSNGALSGTSIEDVDVTGVLSAPVVIAHPVDQTVPDGATFTFTATATGAPVPKVQWQVSTDSGASYANLAGATSATYTAVASLADSGNLYRAVFTNSEGSAITDAARLTVIPDDTTPPAAPGVALAQDTGSSATDGITRDGTLIVTGVEDGAAVQYSTDGGEEWSASFVAVEGPNAVLVRQVDASGNASEATSFAFTLDTTAPAAPGVALAQDTGSSATDGITRDGTLALGGLETSALVEYSTDDGATWASGFVAVEGPNAVLVRQTDAAGNVGIATGFAFVLDTTPPTLGPAFSQLPPFLVGAAGITISVNAADAWGIASESSGAVDTSTAGGKVVTCTATDLAGNVASVGVPYVVGYRLSNVSPAPGSTFKATGKITVSFQLEDANGLLSDQAAAGLLPSISVAFDGLPGVDVKYTKKAKTFSANLKMSKPAAGAHAISIRIIVGGVDVTSLIIPVTIA